jgi:hypothetical protein
MKGMDSVRWKKNGWLACCKAMQKWSVAGGAKRACRSVKNLQDWVS